MRLVAALTVSILVLAACGGGALDDTTSSVPATTIITPTPSTTTTTVPVTDEKLAFSADDALTATDAYFAAADAGDVEAVVWSFTSDAVSSTGFGDEVSPSVCNDYRLWRRGGIDLHATGVRSGRRSDRINQDGVL